MSQSRIAFLATGSELISGDTLNTNTADMAAALLQAGYGLGQQLVVDDAADSMASALQYLIRDHAVVIVVGGLGPTEDDITRQVIAQVISKPLQFNAEAWQTIQARFQALGLRCPENNRQQAFFPPGATVFENRHGTAAGGCIVSGHCLVCWLPGPPNECLPMFANSVRKPIQQHVQPKVRPQWRWLLLRVSESDIADKVSACIGDAAVECAYCVKSPYCRLSLTAETLAEGRDVAERLHALIADRCVDAIAAGEQRECLTVTQQCRQRLQERSQPIQIEDTATGGRLLAECMTPSTAHAIEQGVSNDARDYFRCSGLEAYWQSAASDDACTVTIDARVGSQAITMNIDIPRRAERTLNYAVALIAEQLLALI